MAKARKQKLKVFRTPIGFHDAYVAAPSRKAALEAWGAGTDLFSAKIAEEVGDHSGDAASEALANPGDIIRAARSAADEAEITPSARSGRTEKKERDGPRIKPGVTKKEKPKPRPSRAAVEKAETALARLEGKQAGELAELETEEVRLANRRRALEKKQRQALEEAKAKLHEAERSYRKAMKDWAD